MILIILGSGTAIPLHDRGSPSLVLLIEGSPVLIDIGPGTLRQLTRVGISYEKIERIFLTHFHPDHTADLIHLLFASKNPGVLRRRRPFVITGPSGLSELVNALQDAYHTWLTLPPEMMRIEEIDISKKVERDYGNFTVTAGPTNHTPNSLAYRVEDRSGKTVVYSGDTQYNENLVALAKDADLFICESAFPDGGDVRMHMTPCLAGKAASLANARQLVLTHLYPACDKADITAQCRKTYSGPLIIARDLLRIQPVIKTRL